MGKRVYISLKSRWREVRDDSYEEKQNKDKQNVSICWHHKSSQHVCHPCCGHSYGIKALFCQNLDLLFQSTSYRFLGTCNLSQQHRAIFCDVKHRLLVVNLPKTKRWQQPTKLLHCYCLYLCTKIYK